jgi:hypothetical protein
MVEEKGWLPSLGHASLGTVAISGSQPWTFHTAGLNRESAASLGSTPLGFATNAYLPFTLIVAAPP